MFAYEASIDGSLNSYELNRCASLRPLAGLTAVGARKIVTNACAVLRTEDGVRSESIATTTLVCWAMPFGTLLLTMVIANDSCVLFHVADP